MSLKSESFTSKTRRGLNGLNGKANTGCGCLGRLLMTLAFLVGSCLSVPTTLSQDASASLFSIFYQIKSQRALFAEVLSNFEVDPDPARFILQVVTRSKERLTCRALYGTNHYHSTSSETKSRGQYAVYNRQYSRIRCATHSYWRTDHILKQ